MYRGVGVDDGGGGAIDVGTLGSWAGSAERGDRRGASAGPMRRGRKRGKNVAQNTAPPPPPPPPEGLEARGIEMNARTKQLIREAHRFVMDFDKVLRSQHEVARRRSQQRANAFVFTPLHSCGSGRKSHCPACNNVLVGPARRSTAKKPPRTLKTPRKAKGAKRARSAEPRRKSQSPGAAAKHTLDADGVALLNSADVMLVSTHVQTDDSERFQGLEVYRGAGEEEPLGGEGDGDGAMPDPDFQSSEFGSDDSGDLSQHHPAAPEGAAEALLLPHSAMYQHPHHAVVPPPPYPQASYLQPYQTAPGHHQAIHPAPLPPGAAISKQSSHPPIGSAADAAPVEDAAPPPPVASEHYFTTGFYPPQGAYVGYPPPPAGAYTGVAVSKASSHMHPHPGTRIQYMPHPHPWPMYPPSAYTYNMDVSNPLLSTERDPRLVSDFVSDWLGQQQATSAASLGSPPPPDHPGTAGGADDGHVV